MGIRYYQEPNLLDPVMVACWPGIANVGLLAADTLKDLVKAELFGEIEPWEFFYPRKVIIKDSELKSMEFPGSKFYFAKTGRRDLIIFMGEEQPATKGALYAEGNKAYQMANLVFDVAMKHGCKRIYTSGAAVSSLHHTMRPRVWAVPNDQDLIPEIKKYSNTVLMSDIEARGGQGNITGLNGLLLGVARKHGIEAICVMGEVPVYLQGFPILFPKASKAVLEVLAAAINIRIDMTEINSFAERNEAEINTLYERLPSEVKEQLDKLKHLANDVPAKKGIITEEDKAKILDDIDKFFKKEAKDG
jgi:proteasome assembly chaperone (PAC2) family protein